MAYALVRSNTPRLTDWQLFTNNGNFNNPLPPSRRLSRRSRYLVSGTDVDNIRSRCRTARSRNQSAITTSTRRILSARSVNYRRVPRVEPVDFDLEEEYDNSSVYPSTISPAGRISTLSSQRPPIWAPEAWPFSHLYRTILAIDEQARKDFKAGRTMHALAAWQNALTYCEQLDQRTKMWPENQAVIDEQILTLKRTYKQHLEEMMRKTINIHQENRFPVPRRECTVCRRDQPFDQFHERFSDLCQHVERTICNRCVYNNAKSLPEGAGRTEVACPEPHCKGTFSFQRVRQVLTIGNNIESVEKHGRRSTNQLLERMTEFIWCAHEGCGSGQYRTSGYGASPIVTCIICKRQTCSVHRVKWHKGMTCSEYDRKRESVPTTTEQVVEQITKQCPGCQSNIVNNADSDHMTCPQCKHEFCWECMANYKQIQQNGLKHHNTTCSHYQNTKKQQRAPKAGLCIIL